MLHATYLLSRTHHYVHVCVCIHVSVHVYIKVFDFTYAEKGLLFPLSAILRSNLRLAFCTPFLHFFSASLYFSKFFSVLFLVYFFQHLFLRLTRFFTNLVIHCGSLFLRRGFRGINFWIESSIMDLKFVQASHVPWS